jgi:RNA polymerase sigma-54 factor
MMRPGQYISQRQNLQQRLSPQQIQYIKLLQLPTLAIEMRVKEELEQNPMLEDVSDTDVNDDPYNQGEDYDSGDSDSQNTDPVDSNSEIDWDSILPSNEYEGSTYQQANDDIVDLPDPYRESFLESLENQIDLLSLSEKERIIAEQLVGSLDDDGYLRRDLRSVADSVAFNTGLMTTNEEVHSVLHQIQQIDPPGIGARDLRECLLLQLERKNSKTPGRSIAKRILEEEWESFEKKHFDKVLRRLNINDEQLREAYECILLLDPKPGLISDDSTQNDYVIPDFEVYFRPTGDNTEQGEFEISLNRKNMPALRISPSYKQMWQDLQQKKGDDPGSKETKSFIRSKIESAKSFMDALEQRKHTLMNVMKTIVALQETFFRNGTTLKPMILRDIAERVNMDISTISRIVNGKYVQTSFGVFELKYFFNESVETEDGEGASNRDVKNLVELLIQQEDKSKPLSDDALASEIQKRGFHIARRTVTKYREQMNLPVARMRRQV